MVLSPSCFQRMNPRACAVRSLMRRGRTNWRNGARVKTRGTCCSSGFALGVRPRACVTTTPRRAQVLQNLLDRATTVMTHAPTQANRANLGCEVSWPRLRRAMVVHRWVAKRLKALCWRTWMARCGRSHQLASCQVDEVDQLTRIVVAIDPPGSSHAGSDECGIIVAGVSDGWSRARLAGACSCGCVPHGCASHGLGEGCNCSDGSVLMRIVWWQRSIRVVTWSRLLLRQIDPLVPYRSVHASKGKVRAR